MQITTRDNSNIQSHEQEECKMNSTITADTITKSPVNENNVTNIN